MGNHCVTRGGVARDQVTYGCWLEGPECDHDVHLGLKLVNNLAKHEESISYYEYANTHLQSAMS